MKVLRNVHVVLSLVAGCISSVTASADYYGPGSSNNATACTLLAARFPGKTFGPGSTNYTLISHGELLPYHGMLVVC
jgi:hypothetical protein